MSDAAPPDAASGELRRKTDFQQYHRISASTVDRWVRSGKVERTVLDGIPYFRLAHGVVPPRTAAVDAALADALRDALRRIADLEEAHDALRAEIASLRGAQRVIAAPPDAPLIDAASDDAAPRRRWWQWRLSKLTGA